MNTQFLQDLLNIVAHKATREAGSIDYPDYVLNENNALVLAHIEAIEAFVYGRTKDFLAGFEAVAPKGDWNGFWSRNLSTFERFKIEMGGRTRGALEGRQYNDTNE